MTKESVDAFGRRVLVTALLLGWLAPFTASASITSDVTLDWSSFTWSYSGSSLSWDGFFEEAQGFLESASPPQDVDSGTGDWSGVDAQLGTSATAQASTTPTATPDSGTSPTGIVAARLNAIEDFATALTTRTAIIAAAGSGTARFSVEYSLTQELSSGTSPGSVVASTASLVVYDAASCCFSRHASAELNKSATGSTDGDFFSASGILALEFLLNDGDILQLAAGTSTIASVVPSPIPIPAPLWLFSSALIAIVFIGRRKLRPGPAGHQEAG